MNLKLKFIPSAFLASFFISAISHSTPVRVKYTNDGSWFDQTWISTNSSGLTKINQVLEKDSCAAQVVHELMDIEPVFYNRAKCTNAERFYFVELMQHNRNYDNNRITVSVKCGSEGEILLGSVSATTDEWDPSDCRADSYIRSMLKRFKEAAQEQTAPRQLDLQTSAFD